MVDFLNEVKKIAKEKKITFADALKIAIKSPNQYVKKLSVPKPLIMKPINHKPIPLIRKPSNDIPK